MKVHCKWQRDLQMIIVFVLIIGRVFEGFVYKAQTVLYCTAVFCCMLYG